MLLANTASVTISLRAVEVQRVRDASATYPRASCRLALGPSCPADRTERGRAHRGPLLSSRDVAARASRSAYRGSFKFTSTARAARGERRRSSSTSKGVVPEEMPKTWPDEALKAQAVAARSYAARTCAAAGAFDLYPDMRSQVYGGVAEEPATSPRSRPPPAEVLTVRRQDRDDLFLSTSGGGRWPTSELVSRCPYLVSVADPYDSALAAPRWGPTRCPEPRRVREGA